MTTFGKYLYITFFVTLFLFTTVLDYFKNGNLALLENIFYSFWVASLLFMLLLFRSRKDEKKKHIV
ncbi:RNA polymerase sigma factor [Lysinibacillus contaminans]|uniref:RNA polymerase sigma factor n=1 Tax=Lysinibacillus contaminans TaxID=1293441 RepID=A0ABR5K095_9BACI|nr:RNA polymerase sigma factor [Lysinibacillus contaminans]